VSRTVKITAAKENGQSQRFVPDRALEHYLHNVSLRSAW
jgi:hypothetical protein